MDFLHNKSSSEKAQTELPEIGAAEQTALERRILWSLLVMAGCAELGYATLNISAMPVFLRETKHYSTGAITLIISAYLLCEAIMKSPMGHLSDRYGRKLFLVSAPAICIVTSLLTLLIGHLPIALVPLAFMFAALRALDGIGAAMLWPVAFAMLGEAVPASKRASAMSSLNVTYMIGIAFGPFIGGFVNDAFDSKLASFYAASLLFTLTTIVGLLVIPGDKVLARLRRLHADEESGHKKTDVEVQAGHAESEFNLRDFIECAKRVPQYLLLSFLTFLGVGFPMLIVKIFALEVYALSETQFGLLLMPPAIAMAVLSLPLGKFADRIGRARSVQLGLGTGALGMWLISLTQLFGVQTETESFFPKTPLVPHQKIIRTVNLEDALYRGRETADNRVLNLTPAEDGATRLTLYYTEAGWKEETAKFRPGNVEIEVQNVTGRKTSIVVEKTPGQGTGATIAKAVISIMGAFIGLGFLISLPAWLAVVSEVDPRRRGTYLGAVMTAQGLGAIIGAPIGGFLYDHFAKLAPFFACAIAITLSFVLSFTAMQSAHPVSNSSKEKP